MQGKTSKTNRTARRIARKRRHLCPKCSSPCELYVTARGWKSRGVCPQGHDYPTASLSLELPL